MKSSIKKLEHDNYNLLKYKEDLEKQLNERSLEFRNYSINFNN